MAEELSWVELTKDAEVLLAEHERSQHYRETERRLEPFVVTALRDLQPRLRKMLDDHRRRIKVTYPLPNYVMRPRFLCLLNRKLPEPFWAWDTNDALPETDDFYVGIGHPL